MSNDFLPGQDKELLAWATRFVMMATENITVTQLTSAQISAFHNTIQNARNAISDAEAKHKAAEAATLAKKDELALLTTSARELNRILQGNADVTAETKVKLGLKIRPAKPKSVDPVAPTKLHAVGNSDNQNILSWNANGNPPNTLYEVEASYGEDEPYFVVTALTGTRYVHLGVKPGHEMIYRVRAKHRTGYTDYSNFAAVYPKASPVIQMVFRQPRGLKKAA